MALIRIGVAGWDYPDWAGIVYPSPRPRGFDRLSFLAGFFDAVEINVTFYRQPDPTAAASWIRRVPSESRFRFAAKLYQRLSHLGASPAGAVDLAEEARLYRSGIGPLARSGRLGAVLMQFPQSFYDGPGSRAHIRTLAGLLPDLPLVAEFRHRSWDNEAALALLRDLGVGFCNIDQPSLGSTLPPTAHLTSPVGYIRLHGRNAAAWFARGAPGRADRTAGRSGSARYDYLYSMQELMPWVERARALAASAAEVFIIANNHYRGKGPANALMLKSALTGRRAGAPADLVAAFPELEKHADPVAQPGRRPSQGRLF